MMIIGAHSVIYSRNPEADRAFLRDVMRLSNVDVGGGWLIFGLPPSEVAVHPGAEDGAHEFYFMCEDVAAFVAEMARRGIACDAPQDQGWGILTQLTLPGGGKVGVYQPRHARPKPMSVPGAKSAQPKPKRTAAAKPTTKRKKAAPKRVTKPTRKAAKPRRR